MRHLYLVPAALLELESPAGHHAMECPQSPGLFLVVVEHWVDALSQDRFEAFPDVVELCPWDADKPAPVALVEAFKDSKDVASVSQLDTLGSALWKIRAAWPAARY